MLGGNTTLWLVWGLLSLMLSGWLLAGLLTEAPPENGLAAQARRLLLPGETSHGHYQIELACESCHGEPFGGDEALEKACRDCHEAELEVADDSHPKSKFTDPRNAERVARLDARLCITCHVEHRPQITGAMGLTQPPDVCFHCHQNIAEERSSHEGMDFETCASAGCHNFHDNRALYEDFLAKHLHQPELLAEPRLPERDLLRVLARSHAYPADRWPIRPLAASDVNERDASHANAGILADWAGTRHAAAGVDCGACHRRDGDWVDKPGHRACAACHDAETEGFLSSRHGMRLAQGLSPMTPARARLPMRAEAGDREQGCNACHRAHRFETETAAVEACLGCHDDAHSRVYKGSPHHRLWRREQAGEAPAGSGVSCATCHLPRVEASNGIEIARVQHNPNDTLRPNEKMIRPVCLHCHGLGFSIDALADPRLIENNFRGRPALHVPSLDMAEAREAEAASSTQAKGENP